MASDPSLDWLISVDDHILEPPNLWVDRVAGQGPRPRAAHGGPTTATRSTGSTTASACPSSGLSAVAGKSKEEFSPEPLPYAEMRPGCYDPMARLEDMDRAGVLASLCFPTLPRFCGQLFMEASDREFGFVCLQAYNDWMIDEWCGAAPGRYIPLIADPDVGPAARGRRRWSAARRRARPRSRSPRTRRRSACPRSTTRTATGTR